MQLQKTVLYLYAETPIHTGIGTGLGAVDMPIQREKHTNYPIIQASGIKGALRDTLELELGRDSQDIKTIFGGATGDKGDDFAGAISPSDARILLFPVRALNGVFVWITCPTVLDRYKRETGVEGAPVVKMTEKAQVSDKGLVIGQQVMIEEYTYDAEQTDSAKNWAVYLADRILVGDTSDYWNSRLKSHLVILPDNDFRDFVKYSTEIVTRIQIDDVKKTVKDGALFTQELLPADSILYSLVHVTDSRDGKANSGQILGLLKKSLGDRLQVGGDETVGRGRVQLNWQEVE